MKRCLNLAVMLAVALALPLSRAGAQADLHVDGGFYALVWSDDDAGGLDVFIYQGARSVLAHDQTSVLEEGDWLNISLPDGSFICERKAERGSMITMDPVLGTATVRSEDPNCSANLRWDAIHTAPGATANWTIDATEGFRGSNSAYRRAVANGTAAGHQISGVNAPRAWIGFATDPCYALPESESCHKGGR